MGHRFVGPHVAPTLYLGQKLRSSLRLVVIAEQQRRHEAVTDLGGSDSAQGPGQADAAHRRAGMARFSFERQEVEKGGLLEGPARLAGVSDQTAAPHDRSRRVVVGVEGHLLDAPADGVVAGQFR